MTATLKGQTVFVHPLANHEKSDSGNTLLQTELWGRFKESSGWTAKAFRWICKPECAQESGKLLVLEKKLYKRFPMAYVPHGPELRPGLNAREISGILLGLAAQLKEHLFPGCFVIRFDLACSSKDAGEPLLPPLCRAAYRVQPPDTVILPLQGSSIGTAEDILAGMHKKTRYNIRLASRNGVKIRQYSGQDALSILPEWYSLYRETGLRDGISLHPELYYRNFLEIAQDKAALYMAEYSGKSIAGIIVARCKERVTYLYGASSSSYREQMPNHLLQWQAIEDAFNAGAKEYDFFGIPPTADPDHPMHGLWRFKTGFGGNIHHYLGAWDYPLRRGLYGLYSIAERMRAKRVARRKKLR